MGFFVQRDGCHSSGKDVFDFHAIVARLLFLPLYHLLLLRAGWFPETSSLSNYRRAVDGLGFSVFSLVGKFHRHEKNNISE